ncbi:MAG: hypothetical protein NTX25_05155 [Proteobacteria bacterium]|nr:hypothetical protein [Pseudomonadota bacterium]
MAPIKTSSPQVDEVNKYIFVKAYDRAERMLEDLVLSERFRDDILLHLRRIELATKLDKLQHLRRIYETMVQEQPESVVGRIALILTEQHGELIENKEALLRLQVLLRLVGQHPAIYYAIGFCMEIENNLERARFSYEQCINLDPSWYPGYFGLSQVSYQARDDKMGDQYFFLFEEFAPYNVYGNFETHRRLSNEFIDRNDFDSAEMAIQTLSEWWMENKGFCPPEIQLFERLATARIAELQGDKILKEQRKSQARLVAHRILEDQGLSEGVLYFSAKVLEEFSEYQLSLDVYRKILSAATTSPEIIQKIGSQFLSMGEIELAHQMFMEAYKVHPDQPEIRFCLLVSKLRLAKVNVEDYLISKERLKKLLDSPADKVELLSLLHSMLAKFPEDSDVHGHMGDVYLRLGNKDKAARHFQSMHELDSRSKMTTLRYAAFVMQFGDPDKANNLLEQINRNDKMSEEELCELLWLQANFEFRKAQFHNCLDRLHQILLRDPWDIAYLILEARCLSELAKGKIEFDPMDETLKKLAESDESAPQWNEYDTKTLALERAGQIELVFVREKLRFLYADGDQLLLQRLVRAGASFDARQAIYDVLKLLNTNFDCPEIYWSLGVLFKDLWQLETACVWFDQMLLIPSLDEKQRARAYLEQADCYIWRGVQIEKAVEYAKIALDMGINRDKRPLRVMAHGLLKLGKVRQAEVYLEDNEGDKDPEVIYLRGLVKYRNGAFQQANEVWKPLLTYRSENLRFHTIKQEILRYYFDREPYRGIN